MFVSSSGDADDRVADEAAGGIGVEGRWPEEIDAARFMREGNGRDTQVRPKLKDLRRDDHGDRGDEATSVDDGADASEAFHRASHDVFGIVRVTHAMLPLLRASKSPVIVNVSSGLGSFGVVTNPSRFESKVAALAYCSSKSAVTMLTVQYAKALPEMRINVVDPGYTATDLNHNSGPQTVEQGTDAIVRLATIGKDGPTGTFQDAAGSLPW
jgi:NAD(P)-dependent dehydrogenase (short-subunit alcohol dehydrogenase family)